MPATTCYGGWLNRANPMFLRRSEGCWETVAHDPCLLWSDTLSMATDGHFPVTVDQPHQPRCYNRQGLREKPDNLFCPRVVAQPAPLRERASDERSQATNMNRLTIIAPGEKPSSSTHSL